jgi:hypothetical protein
MSAPFVCLTWLLCVAADLAMWLLHVWVRAVDAPAAKPRHAVYIAAAFPWACVGWCLGVAWLWSAGAPRTLELLEWVFHRNAGINFDTVMRYLFFVPPQLAFGALIDWLLDVRCSAVPALPAKK